MIGPEGGFTEYELSLCLAQGFEPVTLGPRILRTEQAVPALLGRLWSGAMGENHCGPRFAEAF
jgi:RsmE family RNA methyltransferase